MTHTGDFSNLFSKLFVVCCVHFNLFVKYCLSDNYIFTSLWCFCRKMQIPGATDLASISQSSSDINPVKPKEEVKDSYQLDMKVRCPCGSSLLTESMIQVHLVSHFGITSPA